MADEFDILKSKEDLAKSSIAGTAALHATLTNTLTENFLSRDFLDYLAENVTSGKGRYIEVNVPLPKEHTPRLTIEGLESNPAYKKIEELLKDNYAHDVSKIMNWERSEPGFPVGKTLVSALAAATVGGTALVIGAAALPSLALGSLALGGTFSLLKKYADVPDNVRLQFNFRSMKDSNLGALEHTGENAPYLERYDHCSNEIDSIFNQFDDRIKFNLEALNYEIERSKELLATNDTSEAIKPVKAASHLLTGLSKDLKSFVGSYYAGGNVDDVNYNFRSFGDELQKYVDSATNNVRNANNLYEKNGSENDVTAMEKVSDESRFVTEAEGTALSSKFINSPELKAKLETPRTRPKAPKN